MAEKEKIAVGLRLYFLCHCSLVLFTCILAPDASAGYVILGDAYSALHSVLSSSVYIMFNHNLSFSFSVNMQISNEEKLPMISIMLKF